MSGSQRDWAPEFVLLLHSRSQSRWAEGPVGGERRAPPWSDENERLRRPGNGPPGSAAIGLKRLQRRLFFGLDVEELVELRNLEDFVDRRVDVAEDQPAAGLLQLLVERNELGQGGAGEV